MECRGDPGWEAVVRLSMPHEKCGRKVLFLTDVHKWRSWSYGDWNLNLFRHCFGRSDGEVMDPVERFIATPHELALVTGDSAASPQEVVERFVAAVKKQLPPNKISFCTFCGNTADWAWTPQSSRPPHFFAMLWLTCLVAYGYPDGSKESYHERLNSIFGRAQSLNCLPELWKTLETWTAVRSDDPSEKGIRRLILPPADAFRSVIGSSWFLTFPHAQDRQRLRRLLIQNDLSGEEPPIHRTVAVLQGAKEEFSRNFVEDLSNFVRDFRSGDKDMRDSAFWNAVRHEALDANEVEGVRKRSDNSDMRLMASYDDYDELTLYVACKADTKVAEPFEKRELEFGIDGFNYVVSSQTDDWTGIDTAVHAALEGKVPVPKVTIHHRRGVMVFKSVVDGIFELVGGQEASGADVALVRADRVAAFVNAYGGEPSSASLDGWQQVLDCRISVSDNLPAGLEDVLHLQATVASAVPKLIGGIRSDKGFLAVGGQLPRIRFAGATQVEVIFPDGKVSPAARDTEVPDEWHLPDDIVARDSGTYQIRILRRLSDGTDHFATCDFRVVSGHSSHSYKSLPSGFHAVEGCEGRTDTFGKDDDIPLGITGDPIAQDEDGSTRPDLVETLPDVRYLGASPGDVSRTRRPGQDWLVQGPFGRPNLLLFVGDVSDPQRRTGFKNGHDRSRSIWLRAVHKGSRGTIGVRTAEGRIRPLKDFPAVESAFSAMKNRALDKEDSPSDALLPFTVSEEIPGGRITPAAGVAVLADALAALSCRRSGIQLNVAMELLSQVTGLHRFDHVDALYDLLRGWCEAGLVDLLHARGRPVSHVIARRPGFVAYRVADRFHASLIGLLPSSALGELHRIARRRRIRISNLHAPNLWQPAVPVLEVTDLNALRQITGEMRLEPPRWYKAPESGMRGTTAYEETDHLPFSIGSAYRKEKVWDWKKSRFVVSSPHATRSTVNVELRRHSMSCPVYVVTEDGKDVYNSEIRNLALLRAYRLKYGDLPFSDDPDGPVERTWARGLHLPLSYGRSCAVVGSGLSGPVLDASGLVSSYVYPLPSGHRASVSAFLREAEPPADIVMDVQRPSEL